MRPLCLKKRLAYNVPIGRYEVGKELLPCHVN